MPSSGPRTPPTHGLPAVTAEAPAVGSPRWSRLSPRSDVHAVMQFLPIQRLPGPGRSLPSQAGMPALGWGAVWGYTCGPLASTRSGWGTQAGRGRGGQRVQGPSRPLQTLWRGPPPRSAARSGGSAGSRVACRRGLPPREDALLRPCAVPSGQARTLAGREGRG